MTRHMLTVGLLLIALPTLAPAQPEKAPWWSDDVAQAFLHQALALKTTADVTTVDGGNIAAAMR